MTHTVDPLNTAVLAGWRKKTSRGGTAVKGVRYTQKKNIRDFKISGGIGGPGMRSTELRGGVGRGVGY